MTRPAQAAQHPRPGRPPGGLHYSWVIVGILVVVQVIGGAISQSAGVMVPPLRDPHGDFRGGIGTIGALLAVYYLVGVLFAPISGWLAVVRSPAIEQQRRRVFTQHMRRTRAFWYLPLIHGLGCAGHGIVLIYVVPLAVEQGLTLVSASVILSLIAVWSIGGRLLTPIVAERSGGKPIIAAALLIQGLTVLVLLWAHDVWTFYLFGSLFGIGFGGEMSAYLVVNRQYFGAGPTSTLYGWEMMGAMLGHAVATGLAGLVLSVTGSFPLVLALSMAFSLVGMLVILHLESSARVLIPHWEESLPPEARSMGSSGVHTIISNMPPNDLE